MNAIATVSGQFFDRLLGKRLFSLRSAAVSTCYSVASSCLCLFVFSTTKYAKGVSPSLELLGWFVAFTLLGSFPAFWIKSAPEERGTLALWGIVVFIVTAVPVTRIADGVFGHWGGSGVAWFVAFVIVLFGLSFLLDICYIAATRWMLRSASSSRQLWRIIGLILVDVVLGVLLFLSPLAVGVVIVLKSGKHQMIGVAGIGLAFGFILNFIDLIACSVFLLLLLAVLIHLIIWPVLQRPVYAMARYGIFQRKSLLWGLAGAFAAAPNIGTLWKLILKIGG